MLAMYASRSLTKRIGHILASLFALLSVQGICAQTFVAGLPLLDNRLTAATFLYKVNNQKINKAIALLPASESLYEVQIALPKIILLTPEMNPSRLIIVNSIQPSELRSTAIRDQDGFLSLNALMTVRNSDGNLFEVVLLVNPDGSAHELHLIDLNQLKTIDSAPMIQQILGHARVEYDGVPGGPSLNSSLIASIKGNALVIDLGSATAHIDGWTKTPPFPFQRVPIAVLGVNKEWTAVCEAEKVEDLKKKNSRTVYIHSKLTDSWRTMEQEGNLSRTHLFNNWLVTLVQQAWSGDLNKYTVRLETAKGESKTVNGLYSGMQGNEGFISGKLVLDRLDQPEHVVLDTGSEDSEVLDADNEHVVYRVNDTIFSAKIQANRITDVRTLVKDPRIEYVHWMISSK
jgi:hypothetical protein